MGDHRIKTVEELREVVAYRQESALKLGDTLDELARGFIAESPFLVMSTADAEGRTDASPKGDEPGFVRVEDDHTLVIPERPGNTLAMGLTNVLANPYIGLLFVVPGTTETLRVNGRVELSRDPELLEELGARGKPAVLAFRVHVEEVFFHCSKAFVRSGLWKHEKWPPKKKISFGAIVAPKLDPEVNPDLVKAIDDLVEEDARVNL
jgi:PPOX class probable FMN-dependent enzyme